MADKSTPSWRTVTIGKTTYNVKRNFGTQPLETLMLAQLLAKTGSPANLDDRPAL